MSDNDMDYDAIERLLWGLGGQLTCESQSDVLTALRQLRAQVAELESENKRLRQHLIGQIQSDAQDMGLYGGSE